MWAEHPPERPTIEDIREIILKRISTSRSTNLMDYVSTFLGYPHNLTILDVCSDGEQRRRAGTGRTTTDSRVVGGAKESRRFVVPNDAEVSWVVVFT
jgi:hypothetical protein